MRNRLLGILPVTSLAALLFLRCVSLNQVSGGSSSETVIGKVTNEDGTPACSTIVMLYPAAYDPVDDPPLKGSNTDTTDANGRYSVTVPDSPIVYSAVATRLGSAQRAFIPAIDPNGDTTKLPDAMLRKSGAVSVAVPDTADVLNGYLYVPGTGIAVFLNGSAGLVLVDQVPAGTIPSINYSSRTRYGASTPIAAAIDVPSGDTIVIPYPQWRYSRKLYLNTSASGAGISGEVTGFPLLVRLTAATFDFTQAYVDGADIRFSTAPGERLSHEIERWDASANGAELWVNVPRIYGNNDSQYIVMHWGANASSVRTVSNGAGVFDTARGFQGVWHLGGAGDETAFDATANGYHGTPYNMSAASAIAGAIGNARIFNGTTGYIAMLASGSGRLNMPEDGTYALSLWAYADTIDTLWHAIAGKGHEQYYLKLKCFSKGRATWEFVEFQDQKGWEYTEDSVPPAPGQREWVFLTGVRSGTKQYLYINGALVNDANPLMSGNYARNDGDDFMIGRHARPVSIPYFEGWCYFKGRIDEVRVTSFAPDADWIRLCYMNQKAVDELVEFR